MDQLRYQPSDEIVQKYAEVLVRFALWGGQGVRPGDVVLCNVPDVAKPMYEALRNEVLRAGAHPIMNYHPLGLSRSMYEVATIEQLKFFAEPIENGKKEIVTARITITPTEFPNELEGVDPVKVSVRKQTTLRTTRMFRPKENADKFTWTLAFWGIEELAKEVDMSIREYWDVIIAACYLDEPDPAARWRETFAENKRIRSVLNSMEIEKLHVVGDDVNLWIPIGQKRQWVGGSGRNIPSFEIFVSPDWRGVDGWMKFNQPLYQRGVKIEGIELEFKKGIVVRASATRNEAVLLSIINEPDANKIGEFSLTDSRHSRIKRLMGRTLFDENMDGEFEQGNTHIAIGSSYPSTFAGDPTKMTPEKWEGLGFNNPAALTHVDIISTTRRQVTAYLKGGSQKLIYADGQFLI